MTVPGKPEFQDGEHYASNKSQKTDVKRENETLKIDVQPERADITDSYACTQGTEGQQDFFRLSAGEQIQTPTGRGRVTIWIVTKSAFMEKN